MALDADRHWQVKHFGRRLQALVKEVINQTDPMVLIRVGAPEDEYSPEIGDIAATLAHLSSKPTADEVAAIVREVLDKWFGGVSKEENAIDQMARTIAERWDTLEPPHD